MEAIEHVARFPGRLRGRWVRLTEDTRSLVLQEMERIYGTEFRREFARHALAGSLAESFHATANPDVSLFLVGPPASRGFFESSIDGMTVWVHPSGPEIWLLGRDGETTTSDAVIEVDRKPPAALPETIQITEKPEKQYGPLLGSLENFRGALLRCDMAFLYRDDTLECVTDGELTTFRKWAEVEGAITYGTYDQRGAGKPSFFTMTREELEPLRNGRPDRRSDVCGTKADNGQASRLASGPPGRASRNF
jgi:hypothetical protein